MPDFALILKDFVTQIFPRLRTELKFHRKLAKGGLKPDGTPFINKRTGKPYVATTQLTHVLVGLSALTRLLNYLQENSLLTSQINVTEADFRRVCALFCLHDLHKDDDPSRDVQQRDTSIRPSLMLEIANKVSLTEWLNNHDLNGYEYREAMIHLSDTTHGDRKHCRGEISYEKLYSLVRLADTMASIQSLDEGTNSLKNRIKDFARSLKNLHFSYHKIDDYRGLTTNLYHQSVAGVLQQEYNVYPLLFFDHGTIYIGQNELQSFDKSSFINQVHQRFNDSLKNLGSISSDELQYNSKTQRFEKYIFGFSGIKEQLEYLKNHAISRVKKDWFEEVLSKRFSGNQKFINAFKSRDNFLQVFKIVEIQDKQEDFAQKWKAVSNYLGGTLNLLKDVYLAPDNNWQKTMEFLCKFLQISSDIQFNVFDNISIFNQSGTPEFSHILAYHYLDRLTHQTQSVSTIPVQEILEHLHRQLLSKLEIELRDLDNQEKGKNYVEDELAFSFDTHQFLSDNLVLSWEEKREIEGDSLRIITAKNKTGSPPKLCSLCNRVITVKMENCSIKADIIEDGIKEFSNRLLPKSEDVSSRLWCPQCYLEWMSRKLSGLGYAPGAEKNNSARLYFFILPNPIVTPELLDVLRNELNLLKRTSVNVKQYGKDGVKSVPKIWLETKNIDSEGEGKIWLEEVLNSLAEETSRQAESMAKNHKRMAGNYLISSRSSFDEDLDDDYSDDDEDLEMNNQYYRLASNFLILTLESSTYKEPIKKTELWMRGVLTALVLQDLLGMRVYLTDRPYLPVAYLDQINNSLEIDGEHLSLRSLFNYHQTVLPNQLSLRGVPVDDLLDRISALWVINEGLNDEEKGIARCLQEVNHNELAGARFFADYDRKHEGKNYSIFTLACRIILDSFEKKDDAYSMTMKNLAETIATQSLDLFLPFGERDGKGKANRYEKTYRTAISTLKQICREPNLSNEEIIGHIAGSLIKQLERLDTGLAFPFHKKEEEKNQLARRFAETIVVNLFEQRCDRSFSRLSSYENKLADGVFFYVSTHISAKWEYFKEKAKKDKNNSLVNGVNEG